MRKVLITGAGGFIGKAVLKELVCEKDVEIYATTTNKAKMEKFLNENGIYHKVNICEMYAKNHIINGIIYIDDAAKATIKLLNSKMCGAVNIASGEGIR